MNEMQLKEQAEDLSFDGRVHILHDNKHHRYTIAYLITGMDAGCISVHAAGAFCSDRDMFCRKKGRLIAMGRLVRLPVVRQVKSRGQCGRGPIVTGDMVMDCDMPTTAEQWRWLDEQVVEAMNLDEFEDVPF